MTTAAALAPGTTLAGFRIESLVGRGGMGVVYQATQLSLERPVALKLIAPELAADERFRERFLREARLAASLEHPHLLPVYEAGEAEGTLFLALRLVDGDSLAAVLRREGALPPERCIRLFTQLASALEAAHAAGLLHRDVKPHNVLLAGEGAAEHAYLCDFGLARRLGEGSLTEERSFVGTAAYAAPEQIRGEALDARCDLYSLACVFFECLTGHPPFRADDELAVCWAHMYEPAPLLGELDPALAAFDPFFLRALAKDPEERFSSASELAKAAEAALACPAPEAALAPSGPAPKLPRAATSFLGRERELQEVLELLVDEDVRLLTLTGPGGTGKTRLAVRAAEEAAPAFPDGVYLVGLASLRDPSLVTETIAQTLEATQELSAHIADQRLLLLLDSLEHLVETAPELASLVKACPNLTLLVTSRELLRVQAELEYPVPPLASTEGVELFCRRARLEPSDDIADLCARLDHLPLAVELAAARTKALSPAQIVERLSQRLDLLTGARDADPRQQTLRAMIDWSYDLLSEDEQQLFARLSVFQGGCTLEAAEEVAEADLDTLQSLVEKSLVRFTNGRYWMLETIGEYARERAHDDERAGVELDERHSDFYLALVTRAWAEFHEAQDRWNTVVRNELPNIRAALAWVEDHGEPVRLARAVWHLGRFWRRFGTEEGGKWSTRALELIGDEPRAERAGCLGILGIASFERGQYARALDSFETSAAIWRRLGDLTELSKALDNMGCVVLELEDVDRSANLFEEAASVARQAGDEREELAALGNLGVVHALRGDKRRATEVFQNVAEIGARTDDDDSRAWALSNLGSTLEDLGEHEEAQQALAEAMELLDRLGWTWGLTYTLSGLARVALALEDQVRAVRLLCAAERLGESIDLTWQAQEADQREATRASLRAALGDRFDTAWAEAALVPVEDVIADEVGLAASRPGSSGQG